MNDSEWLIKGKSHFELMIIATVAQLHGVMALRGTEMSVQASDTKPPTWPDVLHTDWNDWLSICNSFWHIYS